MSGTSGLSGTSGSSGSSGTSGTSGVGVASGGTTNQILVKNSSTNFDTTWTSSINVNNITATGNTSVRALTGTTLTLSSIGTGTTSANVGITSGGLLITGSTMAYAAIGFSTIPDFSNADMTPVLSFGSGVSVVGNTMVIQRPGVYLLNASIGLRATFAEYAWVDASNVRLTGTNLGIGVSGNSSDPAAAANAMGIVNITSPNTIIKLRIFVGSGFLTQNAAYAGATILQIA
jgi:hypothetical protein